MPKTLIQGKNRIVRETVTDVDALLNHEGFKRMIVRHMETLREHCKNYPRVDKNRKVTVTFSLKPVFNEKAVEYDRAIFAASVGSPTLPATEVEFNCAVVDGQPYFNIEDGDNPLQLTFRDAFEADESDEPSTPDRKSAAVKG